MIGPSGPVRVYLACGVTDMRKGMDGLATQVQTMLRLDPHGGAIYAFRGRSGDRVKLLWWDGQGVCQAAGKGSVCLATGGGRDGIADAGPVIDAAGGDRLAEPAAELVARGGVLRTVAM